MSQVKVVAHPETGNVITPSTNSPGFGTVRLDSSHVSMEGGFINRSRRTAFLRGRVEDLNAMEFTEGKVLPGIIVKRESYAPFYDGQTPKQYPVGAMVNGQPVGGQSVLTEGKETYLEYVYTQDSGATPDVWVGSTQTQTVQQAQEDLAAQAV